MKSLRYTLSTPINMISGLFTKMTLFLLILICQASQPEIEETPLSETVIQTVKESIHSVGDTISGTQNIKAEVVNLATLNITNATDDFKNRNQTISVNPCKNGRSHCSAFK